MFEHRKEPLLPRRLYLKRVLRNFTLASTVICGSLFTGVLGYHYFEGLSWLDSLLNASMILSGMGPVNALTKTAGKWFASFYALFSGVTFITSAGVLFAPVIHRFFHKFHLEFDMDRERKKNEPE